MMQKIFVIGLILKNTLLFSALLCLLSAFQNGSASDGAAPVAVPSEGEVFRDALKDGGEGPEMVVLPTGSFRMGDLSADVGL